MPDAERDREQPRLLEALVLAQARAALGDLEASRLAVDDDEIGLALVERLNIGVIACLPAGMAAYLLANRLIPADLPGRSDLEVQAMFWVWFGLAAVSLVRPARRAWRETLALAAAAFAAIPLVNALTTDRGLFASLATGDGLFAAFDLSMLAIAALIGFGAWRAGQARPLSGSCGS